MTLVLELAARRRDVGVPALGHPAPRQLHGPRIERGLELQQQQRLFYIQNLRHDR
jgi:hypothetical protein